MREGIRHWLAAIVSFLLLFAGFVGIASGITYQTLLGGSLDLVYYLPFVAVFAAGFLVFFWDRQDREARA